MNPWQNDVDTRAELIAVLAAHFPSLTAEDSTASVKLITEAITDSLRSGGKVEIRGFGSFALNQRPARVGRNPKTGEEVMVSSRLVPHFKAGKELRERVDKATTREVR